MTVATLITVAALPALWFMQRDSATPGSGVAAAGPSGGIVIAGSSDTTATTTTTLAPVTSGDGAMVALVTESSAERAPAASTIPVDRRISGTATYKRYSGYGVAAPCMAPRVPVNTKITVYSQNTGRTVTCVNVVSYAALPDPQVVVVIDTDTFLQMADTRDAPVFVEITW